MTISSEILDDDIGGLLLWMNWTQRRKPRLFLLRKPIFPGNLQTLKSWPSSYRRRKEKCVSQTTLIPICFVWSLLLYENPWFRPHWLCLYLIQLYPSQKHRHPLSFIWANRIPGIFNYIEICVGYSFINVFLDFFKFLIQKNTIFKSWWKSKNTNL